MSLHRYGLLGTSPQSFQVNDAGTGVDTPVTGQAAAETGAGVENAMAPCAVETAAAADAAVRPIAIADTASFDDLYAHPPTAIQANVAAETGNFAEDPEIGRAHV